MRKLPYILGIICTLLVTPSYATTPQDTTTFNQVVTVEREYQPEIEQATILPITPSILQAEVDLNPVVYSTYSTPLSIGYNLYPLGAAALRFTPPTTQKGLLDLAVGHHNTHLDFDYQLLGNNNTSAHIFAKHNAYWGSNTLSHTKIGGEGDYSFNKAKLYYGIEGGNSAYTLTNQQKLQALSHAQAYIGIYSNSNKHLQYKVQTGYKAFFTPALIEHQIRSHFDFALMEGQHQVGVKLSAQNNLYHSTSIQNLQSLHNVHIEPFYELEERKIKLHVGVNLDMNIGTAQMLSATENISFAPSPNLQFEWYIVPEKLHLHTQVNGSIAKGTIDESMHLNRYFNINHIATRREAKTYVPVAANLGFTARPLRTMLIDVYGGYTLLMNDHTMVFNDTFDYTYLLHNYQCAYVGASVLYHYRDIVQIKADGNYYFWQNLNENMPVYDRPEWDASLRVDVNIDKKWSIYSDNKLEGERLALTTTQDEILPMTIDLNIGAEYDINRWINVYLQLGNYLNRKNPIYYGYNTQGCHFLAGFKYVF